MNTVDLFSGCGGLSLGFQNAGFEVVAAFDNWLPAVRVYRDNFQHPIYEIDLSSNEATEAIAALRPQLIIGGPPCQDFSSAGKRDETQGRADMTVHFAEIVAECQPDYFVMENVERIGKSKALKKAIEIFQTAGYALSPRVLDASYCGVPQARKRFFMAGHINGQPNFLDRYFERRLSPTPMTVHEYLGDTLGTQYYYRHPRSYQRRGIFSIHEPSPTIRGVNRPIPATYRFHPGDATHNLALVRPLTTIERSYIQSFPLTFIWNGTNKTDLEQMIGNAVPPLLAQFVASCLREYIIEVENGTVPVPQAQELRLF